MSEQRCELTLLIVSQCAHCVGIDPLYARPFQEGVTEMWWEE